MLYQTAIQGVEVFLCENVSTSVRDGYMMLSYLSDKGELLV